MHDDMLCILHGEQLSKITPMQVRQYAFDMQHLHPCHQRPSPLPPPGVGHSVDPFGGNHLAI